MGGTRGIEGWDWCYLESDVLCDIPGFFGKFILVIIFLKKANLKSIWSLFRVFGTPPWYPGIDGRRSLEKLVPSLVPTNKKGAGQIG
jgi:hypothetical protein